MATGFITVGVEFPTLKKSPASELYIGVDWGPWLAKALPPGDIVASAVWDVPAGLTASGAGNDTTRTWKKFVGGGAVGAAYECACTVTTVAGNKETQTFIVRMARK